MTIVIALLVIPILPDYPLQRANKLMSHELQIYAEWRIRKENAGIRDEDPESVWWGLKQTLIDPKLYMFIVLQMALITAQSFNNFFPSIVGTLGYSTTITLLLTAPPYLLAFFVSLGLSFHAAHKHERGWHIAIPMMFALLGNLLVMRTFLMLFDRFEVHADRSQGHVCPYSWWALLLYVPHDRWLVLTI